MTTSLTELFLLHCQVENSIAEIIMFQQTHRSHTIHRRSLERFLKMPGSKGDLGFENGNMNTGREEIRTTFNSM